MSGSFQLTLDTTKPAIEITAPSYTTPSAKTDIWIYGEEELSSYQNFYFIDSRGERHDVIFEHLGDSFHGVMYFSNFPTGITTFYAQVKDEVRNLSNVESISINISSQQYFSLKISHHARKAQLTFKRRRSSINARVRKVGVSIQNE